MEEICSDWARVVKNFQLDPGEGGSGQHMDSPNFLIAKSSPASSFLPCLAPEREIQISQKENLEKILAIKVREDFQGWPMEKLVVYSSSLPKEFT